MAWAAWGTIYSKSEKSPLDRFKNRNRLLKTFGENGPRAYDLLDGKSNAATVQEQSGIDRDEFALLMDFMVSNGLAVTGRAKSPQSKPAPKGRRARVQVEEEDTPSSEDGSGDSQGVDSAIDDELPADSDSSEDAESGGDSGEGALDDSESEPDDGEPDEIKISQKGKGAKKSPREEYADSLSPLERLIYDKYGENGVKVYNLIDGEKTAEEILKETGISEEKLVEILEFMNEEGIIKLEKPPGKKQEKRPPMGFEPPPPPREKKSRAPPSDGDEGESQESDSSDGDDSSDSSGSSDSSDENASSSQKPASDVGFKPMVEETTPEHKAPAIQQPSRYAGLPGAEKDELGPGVVPVDVAIIPKYSILQRLKLPIVLMKLGSNANAIISKVDGEKDFVDLAVETRQPLANIDVILGALGKEGLMSFRQLTRGELQRRYGDDGFAVYKRYGRDGLLIYQLIGKVNSLRDIVALTKMDSQKAGEIILFVHKVLGLDMPLERDMVYRYLQR